MKREIPILTYDDAWQILARGKRLNGLVIDAGSEEVMLRIEETMSSAGVDPIFNSITFMSCYSECTAVASPENCILNPDIELAVRFKLRQDI